jgi:hypothetical protein
MDWDTEIYNSFGEWLASPYSDTDTGQTVKIVIYHLWVQRALPARVQ